MRACELDELCVAGVYGAEGGGAHNKARTVDEELFGAGYGFIPDRLEGALGHAFRRQVARELAVDVPFVQNARVERLALPDELAKHSRPRTCAGDDERVRITVWAPNFHAAEALVEGAMLKAVELANCLAREYVLGCAGAKDPPSFTQITLSALFCASSSSWMDMMTATFRDFARWRSIRSRSIW